MTSAPPTPRTQFAEYVTPVDLALLLRRLSTALGVLGGVFATLSMLAFLRPDAHQSDPTGGNSSIPASTLVTGYARDYVTTYLTAKSGDEHQLARFVTLKDLTLPPIAGRFTDTDVAFAKQVTTTDDGVALWTVTVSGVVNGDTAPAPQRTFYRVAITVLDGAPRATTVPTQVAGPGIGVDLRLGYRHTVTPESALGTTATGFVRSYLTGGADFPRYVTVDSSDRPIQPAPYAKVDTLTIDADVGGDGAGADTAEVYITVAARTKNYTLTQLAYPLTVRSVEGQWHVLSIAAVPVLQARADTPQHSEAVTATPTPPPPPPTRG